MPYTDLFFEYRKEEINFYDGIIGNLTNYQNFTRKTSRQKLGKIKLKGFQKIITIYKMNKILHILLLAGPVIFGGGAFASFSQTKIPSSSSVKTQTKKLPAKLQRTFIALGDSLTEGYQLNPKEAYPYLLETRLNREFPKYKTKVVNAGISGSTTSSGVNRLKKHLRLKPTAVFISLGSNDGLRGTPVDSTKQNLQNMIDLARANNISVLLTGLKLPMNYGTEYREAFEKIFKDLSQTNKITYIPFLLEGVAGNPDLNLPDLIHPNEKGHKVMAETLYPYFKRFYD